MFITDCLAYTDISVELTQQDEIFIVSMKANKGTDISITLNYLQVKLLAEGLLAITGQAKLNELTKDTSKYATGDIKLSLYCSTNDEIENSYEKGETLCQQQPLSVLTEKKHLFKTA